MVRTTGGLRDVLTRAIQRWAESSGAVDPGALARRTTRAIVTLTQGWIAHTAVFGPIDSDDFLADARVVLNS